MNIKIYGTSVPGHMIRRLVELEEKQLAYFQIVLDRQGDEIVQSIVVTEYKIENKKVVERLYDIKYRLLQQYLMCDLSRRLTYYEQITLENKIQDVDHHDLGVIMTTLQADMERQKNFQNMVAVAAVILALFGILAQMMQKPEFNSYISIMFWLMFMLVVAIFATVKIYSILAPIHVGVLNILRSKIGVNTDPLHIKESLSE